MGNRFDELAKSLAGSVSRREALVRLGGAAAAAAQSMMCSPGVEN
jgi:hypothetical protein